MAAKTAIAEALAREVGKLIRRHNKSTAATAQSQKKYQKRSGQPGAAPTSLVPPHWALNPHFNPYHVRARIESFSHALAKKIRTSSYEPSPSLLLPIPKPGGGSREISIFTAPDAAVAYWLGSRLIKRNSYRFSSYTYAYRADRNAHHAIEHLMGHIRGRARLFVLEYDFAKYFDTIRHDYLQRILDEHFLISPRELHLLQKFLTCPHANSLSAYAAGTFGPRTVGIPQGSNISLFLDIPAT
jgi:retron-type reverse transcriptase